MLEDITPLLLTFDEMPNLERTFAALEWAKRIVVVDSGSTDGTAEWLRRDSRVALFTRTFDAHGKQWEYGLRETDIRTPWVLALDADHVLTPECSAELRGLSPAPGVSGFEARFTYCVEGKKLRGGLYPPRIALARVAQARFRQDGHTQRLEVDGGVQRLSSAILHDDRKPRTRFLAGQARYALQEAEKLLTTKPSELSRTDRIRKLGWIAPWLVPFWCLVVKRGILDGRAGLIYAGERAIAEWLIAMAILENRLKSKSAGSPA
ncbi:MAG: glycosyltransferase family 2 protein [Thermoanaerobaculia bacterium]